jgi:hypothetical protein
MNVRWGFDLDMSAVRLMRRDGGRWLEIAREKIDGADIEDRLMAMVDRVDSGASVDLFLPREQILYTDVKISSEASAGREIRAAMDGRTPYALDDLEIDWVLTAPNTARVAAIARETLDEAKAFAEVRGLGVSGLSSLADADDFPRMPDFGGGPGIELSDVPAAVAKTPAAPPSEPVPAFSSVRDDKGRSQPPTPRKETEPSEPVVRVDDSTPVMQVKANPLPPLDPGPPLDVKPAAPRVRTDIAASSLSGAAASLTAPAPSIRIRVPQSNSQRTLAVFAIAAALTIGIAAIVWSILPLAPGRTGDTPPARTETGFSADVTTPEEQTAAAELPDLPVPSVMANLSALGEPTAEDSAPGLPGAGALLVARAATSPLPEPQPDAVFAAPAIQQLEPRPVSLAGLETADPVQSLDGAEETAETTLDIYFASIERRDLATDAIALPAARAFSAEALPAIGAPALPAEAPEDTVVAAIDPTLVPETSTEQAEAEPVAAAPATEPPLSVPATSEDTASETEAEPVTVPTASADAPDATAEETPSAGSLRPTALAAALTDRAPRARPAALTQNFERQRFGGRTEAELARVAPRQRPASDQLVAQAEREPVASSELAVQTSAPPRGRPQDFDAIVAAAAVPSRAPQVAASLDFETPDTSSAIEAALADDAEPEPRPQDSPRLAIPSSASVARQATIEDAIPLNKINLVGVYGVPSDRRALIRLPSGRYVKVKVGDRVDGGTVAQISDSEVIYRKGSRTVALAMPKG